MMLGYDATRCQGDRQYDYTISIVPRRVPWLSSQHFQFGRTP